MEELVERIYEAALVPEEWPQVLEGLATASHSLGSTLFTFEPSGRARGVSLSNLKDLLVEFLASDTLLFSTSVTRMCSVQPNSFIEVDKYLSPDEILLDPARIRLRALGFGAHVCTAIPMPMGELVVFVLQRALSEGGYSHEALGRLNELRPHLARAGLIAARLRLERAEGTVAGMEALGLPAAVLANGRVLAANRLLENLPIFVTGLRDHLSLNQHSANILFQQALEQSAAGVEPIILSVPIFATESAPAHIVHVVPVRRTARDVFTGADVLVVATAANPTALAPSQSVLIALFDLAPAEAKLAVGLSEGKTLKQIATESSIRISTARFYLERIFRKTGTSQQSQLVALLKSAALLRTS
ncbi:hypothetical protein JNW90_16835 [Micromonospora sp. STR1s_5]|nr:hypothetical protein [Micromonospora sp. STR1s_5]